MQGRRFNPADRALLLAQIAALASTMPLRRACAELNVCHLNYYRWQKEAAQIQSGLITPRLKLAKGRRPSVELTEEEQRRLKFWRLVKGSIPLALEAAIAESLQGDSTPYFEALKALHARSEEQARRQGESQSAPLRAEVARALFTRWQAAANAKRPVSWPLSVQRACRVTEAEEAAFRGEKALDAHVGTERRGAFYVNEEGQKVPWFAGFAFCSDDMSTNEPFKFYDAAAGAELVGRQVLFTEDAFSLHFLGHTHIGRDRDSYRAEDIAAHFKAVVEEHGLPVVWRVEKGRWDNHFLHGTPIPGLTDEETGEPLRWGGVNELVKLAVKFKSRGKEIESSFNLLQNILAHGGDGRALSIGRMRGEFEAAARHLRRAHDGQEDALEKFWSIAESAEQITRGLHVFNHRPKQRECMGNQMLIPAELWATHLKRPCPADQMWRFCAVKVPARIGPGGVIEVTVRHYPVSFRFRVHGASRIPGGAHFDVGHEVMIAFDPHEAWSGCHVFNRDRSARNRDGWRWLERIGIADHMAEAPQEDLSGAGAHSSGQRKAGAQVRRETRTIFSGTELGGTRRSHAQDGFGSALTAEVQSSKFKAPGSKRRARGVESLPAEAAPRRSRPAADLAELLGDAAPRREMAPVLVTTAPSGWEEPEDAFAALR